MLAAVQKAMLADVQATAPAAAPTTPMPSGLDGGPLGWESYKAYFKNLEREQDHPTPDVTLLAQWGKYNIAFATELREKGAFV